MDLDIVLKSLEKRKMRVDLAKEKLFQSKAKLMKELQILSDLEKIKIFLMGVANTCQKETIEYIENIVTFCIQLYGEHWKFQIEIKDRRDQQEFFFYFNEGDIQHSIKDDILAGGLLDMTNLGLKIARHSLNPEAEPILLLDEPFKNLGDKIDEGMQILRTIIEERKIQVVIITHDERVTHFGDKVIQLKNRKE